MNASSHRHRYARLGAICLTTATLVIGSALPAWAIIPELSATMNNPSPNPVPAGSTATATATFSLSADSGPITVGIELPDTSFGTLRLDTAGTGAQLTNCLEGATTVTCDWDGLSVNSPQTLSVFVDVDANVTPGSGANISAIASSATEAVATYSTNGLQAAPPLGSVTLSGTVITEGGAPVAQACIYILTSPPFVIPTLTDSAGQWQVTNLPDSYSYAIGVIPPFDLGFGPCANNGPPPIPAPGRLAAGVHRRHLGRPLRSQSHRRFARPVHLRGECGRDRLHRDEHGPSGMPEHRPRIGGPPTPVYRRGDHHDHGAGHDDDRRDTSGHRNQRVTVAGSRFVAPDLGAGWRSPSAGGSSVPTDLGGLRFPTRVAGRVARPLPASTRGGSCRALLR